MYVWAKASIIDLEACCDGAQTRYDLSPAGCMGSAARDCLRVRSIPQRLAVWVDPPAIDWSIFSTTFIFSYFGPVHGRWPSVYAQANRAEPMRMLPSAVPLKKHIMTRSDPAAHRAVGAKKICRSPTKNVLSRLRWIAYLTACLPTALALIPKLGSKSWLNHEVRPEDPPPPPHLHSGTVQTCVPGFLNYESPMPGVPSFRICTVV